MNDIIKGQPTAVQGHKPTQRMTLELFLAFLANARGTRAGEKK